jgi:hypothetical protein
MELIVKSTTSKFKIKNERIEAIENDNHNLTDHYTRSENFRHRIDAAEMLPKFSRKDDKTGTTV